MTSQKMLKGAGLAANNMRKRKYESLVYHLSKKIASISQRRVLLLVMFSVSSTTCIVSWVTINYALPE